MYFAGPPVHQLIIVGCRITHAPVDLRGHVIDPAVLDPGPHIGIHAVIRGHTGFCIRSRLIHGLVAPYAERADSIFDVRFYAMNALSERLDKGIDISAAPIRKIGVGSIIVLAVCRVIFKDRIGRIK